MKNIRFKDVHTVSDIVDTMIRGLKKEWVNVRMDTFAVTDGKICYGCAATNTLCELMQKSFSHDKIHNRTEEFNYGITWGELKTFEIGIDSLRIGFLSGFIGSMRDISHITGVVISEKDEKIIKSYTRKKTWWRKERFLPTLYTSTYKENLVYYEKLRDWLRKKGL